MVDRRKLGVHFCVLLVCRRLIAQKEHVRVWIVVLQLVLACTIMEVSVLRPLGGLAGIPVVRWNRLLSRCLVIGPVGSNSANVIAVSDVRRELLAALT